MADRGCVVLRLDLGIIAPELHRVCVNPPSRGRVSLEADFVWKGNQELQLTIKDRLFPSVRMVQWYGS